MLKLTDENRSDEEDENEDSDVYSPPASTVLNTSSDPDERNDNAASVNDPETESESQVLFDGDEDRGNRMEVDIPDPQDRRTSVAQVRNKVRLSC